MASAAESSASTATTANRRVVPHRDFDEGATASSYSVGSPALSESSAVTGFDGP